MPITMNTLQLGCIAPVIHHLRPFSTYSSPSRSMLMAMLVASLDATSGSVMANAERIWPSSNGRSHMSFCSCVPNIVSTSMLPVSGAEQLHASLAMVLRPMISASGAYSALVRPGTPLGVRVEEVPQSTLAGLCLQLLHDRGMVMRVSAGDDLFVEHGLIRIDALVHEIQQSCPVLVAAIG